MTSTYNYQKIREIALKKIEEKRAEEKETNRKMAESASKITTGYKTHDFNSPEELFKWLDI